MGTDRCNIISSAEFDKNLAAEFGRHFPWREFFVGCNWVLIGPITNEDIVDLVTLIGPLLVPVTRFTGFQVGAIGDFYALRCNLLWLILVQFRLIPVHFRLNCAVVDYWPMSNENSRLGMSADWSSSVTVSSRTNWLRCLEICSNGAVESVSLVQWTDEWMNGRMDGYNRQSSRNVQLPVGLVINWQGPELNWLGAPRTLSSVISPMTNFFSFFF